MTLPFTIDEFLDVFRRYNESMWPVQWLLVALAVAMLVAATHGGTKARSTSRVTSGILAAFWIWMGVAYHLVFFRAINPAATLFGVGFIVEGALIAWFGVVRNRLEFELRSDMAGRIGLTLAAYALIVYPLVGHVLGHRYPSAPTFGVPCPTTIFTLGMLLLCRAPCPLALIIIPAGWSLLGVFAALRLGMWEDVGLVVAALAATPVILSHRSVAKRERYVASRPSERWG
jgi:Family of unknown function (DUF6064)